MGRILDHIRRPLLWGKDGDDRSRGAGCPARAASPLVEVKPRCILRRAVAETGEKLLTVLVRFSKEARGARKPRRHVGRDIFPAADERR